MNFGMRTIQTKSVSRGVEPPLSYKPKNGSISGQCRSIYESLSSQLREITDMLALQITSIETNLPEP